MDSKQLLAFALDKIDDMKARDVVQIDVKGNSDITDYMLVCSGNSKRHVQSIADHVAKYFVAIILVIAGATWFYWHQHRPDEAFWIMLSVLVATCPCALSLATPTAVTCSTSKLGSLGIKATVEVNHLGNEIIKFSGWPNIRKILNAPRFRLDNPKVVDVGIGKYGLKNSIVSGARLTFYVAAAYRTVDFILNDETTLTRYIGSLATDVVKIGIASAVSWGLGAVTMTFTSFALGPLVIAVGFGLATSITLNYFDEKYELTDKVVAYIEHAQQEVIEKGREIEEGFWDLGAMFAHGLLETGREVIVSELKTYVRRTLNEITPRSF